MTRHLPVLPPTLAGPSDRWSPRDSFSPSQLSTYTQCHRKWAWRYLFGVREARKSKAAMLGSVIHSCLEAYLHGRTVYQFQLEESVKKEFAAFTVAEQEAIIAEAPKRAIASLHLLPKLDECEIVEVEQWIDIDTRRINAAIEPIKIVGKIDLRYRRAATWYTHDHKSTAGRRSRQGALAADPWAYVKTVDELRTDPQGVFYPLDGVHKHGLSSIWSRWAYSLTDPRKHPQARAVDWESHRDELEREAASWLIVADEMRATMRAAPSPDEIEPPSILPPSPASPCNAFGGCPYRFDRGGPCNPGNQNLGAMILAGASPAQQPTTIEGDPMSLASLLNEQRSAPPAQPAAPAGPMPPPVQTAFNPPEAQQPAPVQTTVAPPGAGAPPAPVWDGQQWVIPAPQAAAVAPAAAPPAAPPPAAVETPKGKRKPGRPKKSDQAAAATAPAPAAVEQAPEAEAEKGDGCPGPAVYIELSAPDDSFYVRARVTNADDIAVLRRIAAAALV